MRGSLQWFAFAYSRSEQWTGTVALLAILVAQRFEPPKHFGRTNLIAPREQPVGIIDALRHGKLDVAGRRNAHPDRVHRLVDEHRDDPVDDAGCEPLVAARLGRARSFTVVVVASLALPAEQPRIDEPPLGERRPVARIEEESFEYTRRHGEVHVVADEIHQLERTHAEAADFTHRPVDRRDIGHTLLEDAQRLAVERPRDAIDDESRRIRRDD